MVFCRTALAAAHEPAGGGRRDHHVAQRLCSRQGARGGTSAPLTTSARPTTGYTYGGTSAQHSPRDVPSRLLPEAAFKPSNNRAIRLPVHIHLSVVFFFRARVAQAKQARTRGKCLVGGAAACAGLLVCRKRLAAQGGRQGREHVVRLHRRRLGDRSRRGKTGLTLPAPCLGRGRRGVEGGREGGATAGGAELRPAPHTRRVCVCATHAHSSSGCSSE